MKKWIMLILALLLLPAGNGFGRELVLGGQRIEYTAPAGYADCSGDARLAEYFRSGPAQDSVIQGIFLAPSDEALYKSGQMEFFRDYILLYTFAMFDDLSTVTNVFQHMSATAEFDMRYSKFLDNIGIYEQTYEIVNNIAVYQSVILERSDTKVAIFSLLNENLTGRPSYTGWVTSVIHCGDRLLFLEQIRPLPSYRGIVPFIEKSMAIIDEFNFTNMGR